MKNIKNTFAVSVASLVLAFAMTALADDSIQGVATVVRVKGLASYTLGGNDSWHPLVVGKILQAGATISTKPDATVDVVLGKQVAMPQARPYPDRISEAPDAPVRGVVNFKPSAEQNVVRLSGGTTLKIDTLTVSDTGADTVSDTELDLQAGRIFASVKKLSESSKYLVKIPNGIAGVRGTKFTISADGSIGCIEHSVWLSLVGADGKPTTVEVGQGTQYNAGSGASEPISPQLLNLLNQISVAANTTYLEIVSYAVNRAQTSYISPITGLKPSPPKPK